MKEIINISEKSNSSKSWTPKDILSNLLKEFDQGKSMEHVSKVLILTLDENSGQYDIGFYQSDMKLSECLSLCEVAKSHFLKIMGY